MQEMRKKSGLVNCLSWIFPQSMYTRRATKRGVELIEALKPEYAVVTAQEPENEIREAFKENGTQVYTTVNRDVVFVSDGAGIWPVLKE